jgi:8-oxo-dGTP pyrophosphatase MutT (NUDIX family)
VSLPNYRITVAGIVVQQCTSRQAYPPVLLQWSSKAARCGEGNLATVQGGVEPTDEDFAAAMRRELYEEHGLQPYQYQLCTLSHREYTSAETGKSYVWFLVVCQSKVVLRSDETEVAAADWYYCPQALLAGVRWQMRKRKARMFREVFAAACEQYPEYFGGYPLLVARFRKLDWRRRNFRSFAASRVHSRAQA